MDPLGNSPIRVWWYRLRSRIARTLRALFRLPLLSHSPKRALPARSQSSWSDDTKDYDDDLLPDELWQVVHQLNKGRRGVVTDTISRALQDYSHLRELMMGPGATLDAAFDVTLIGGAESLLRALVVAAPNIQTLVDVAGKRESDKDARASAGDAILDFQDRGRVLRHLACAAVRWASTRTDQDAARLRQLATQL